MYCTYINFNVFLGYDVPMPYAANLEVMALPQVEDIIKVCKR